MKTDAIKDWPIHEIPGAAELLRRRLPEFRDVPVALYRMRHCQIIVAQEPPGWHLSISCPDRDPTWQEIATARYRLLGAVPTMAMFLPPLDEYVNLHPFTFHVHESHEQDSRIIIAR